LVYNLYLSLNLYQPTLLKMEIKELTRAEEQIMQVLWQLEKGFVKDVLDVLPEPKPAYNTVSTIIRILETKGFVNHNAFGKSHEYYPIVSKEQYKDFAADKLLHGYFDNSVNRMLSFFVKKEKINLKEADEIMKLIEKLKDK
jgi:BlaI family penicillinase repressor